MNKSYYCKYLLYFSIGWLIIGVYLAYDIYKIAWSIRQFNSLSIQNQNTELFGVDYLLYQSINKLSKDKKILMLVPSKVYLYRAIYFLYPRNIYVVKNIDDISDEKLKEYDYFSIYISTYEFSGCIKNQDIYQQQTLNFASLLEFLKDKQLVDKSISQDQFLNLLYQTRGAFLFKINK